MTAPLKPHALTVDPDKIPAEFKDLSQCVVWRYEPDHAREGWTKVPLNAKAARQGDIRNASSTKPATWNTFDDALAAYKMHPPVAGDVPMPSDPNEVGHDGLDGVGVVLAPENGITGVDLDHALDADGKLLPWAVPVLERFTGTYVERSPSGTGLRIFCYGKKPSPELSKVGDVEIYDGRSKNGAQGGRYLTVTGHRYGDARDLKDKQDAVTWLYQTYLVAPKEKAKAERRQDETSPKGETATPSLDDAALLERMFGSKGGAAIQKLWDGDASEHPSDSEADLALASHLLWWCNYDAARADGLFRLSGLMRPKWNELRGSETYGGLTLTRAGEGKGPGDGYAPRKKPKADKGDGGDDDDAPTPPDSEEKRTQAQLLIELTLGAVSDFFHTLDGTAYALVPVGEHHEVMRLRYKAFRSLLYKLFYEAFGKPPGSQAVQDALAVLEAKAQHEGEQRPVYVRLASHEGRVYLDLADDSWRVVEVDTGGWRILARSPVMFERPKGLKPLPTPTEDEGLEGLRRFVNVSEDDWHLLLGFLVACLYPHGPFPLLVLIAEQGSGKTTLARIIKRLLDDNLAPVRSAPREERDLMIAAQHAWILVFDNMSGISTSLSDALCRLSTGGGFSTRELYSDSEETIFDAQRPVVITAIDDVATRSDLLDRALILNLQRIDKTERRTERELYRALDRVLPGALGALLTGVSIGLKELPQTRVEDAPRMADFATWATACEKGLELEPGSILKAYRANRAGANDLVLEVSPVSAPLKLLLEVQQPDLIGVHRWEGTSGELLGALEAKVDERTRKQKAWPNTPRALSGTLQRIAPNLREAGIDLDRTRTGSKRLITLTFRTEAQTTVTTVTTVTAEEKPREERKTANDANDDAKKAVTQPSSQPSPEKGRAARHYDGSDANDGEIQSHSKWSIEL